MTPEVDEAIEAEVVEEVTAEEEKAEEAAE